MRFSYFRKVFRVSYEDSSVYPDLIKTIDSISKYCEQNGASCTFTADDEAEINGKKYKISREYEPGSRGNYSIKCTEKE